MACVESARWNVYVLCFNLEPAHITCEGPIFNCAEQPRADSLSAFDRSNSEIPEHGHVSASREKIDALRIPRDDGTTDSKSVFDGCQNAPATHIEALWPLSWVVEGVVVLGVGRVYGADAEAQTLETLLGGHNIENLPHVELDGNLRVFGQRLYPIFYYGGGHWLVPSAPPNVAGQRPSEPAQLLRKQKV